MNSTATADRATMQVIVALARADGHIVTRDELIERCWEGRIVTDDAINRVLSQIRQLGSGIGGGSFTVETILKVGDRLVANQYAEPALKQSLQAPESGDER